MEQESMPSERNNPGFLGIGAPKTATTWLHHCLSEHLQVWLPPRKELHFFNRQSHPFRDFTAFLKWRLAALAKSPFRPSDDTVYPSFYWTCHNLKLRLAPRHPLLAFFHSAAFLGYAAKAILTGDTKNFGWHTKYYLGRLIWKPERWYARLFAPAPGQISGEICPDYHHIDEQAVAYLADCHPSVKIIYLLRNPIERDFSQLNMYAKGTPANLTAAEVVSSAESYRTQNDYLGHLAKYLRHLPAENIFVGFYEDILLFENDFLSSLQEFLEVQPHQIKRDRIHSGGYAVADSLSVRALAEYHLPHLQEMAETLEGHARFWLDVATGLTESSPPTAGPNIPLPLATNPRWQGQTSGFQSGRLSNLPWLPKMQQALDRQPNRQPAE